MMKILITGVAGFIGNQLALRLLDLGNQVIGLDNLNDYYDVRLKRDRLLRLENQKNFFNYLVDINDEVNLSKIFEKHKPDYVINLAAQAGVRYSLINPKAYIDSNISGFLNILENCRHNDVRHLIYASSSSVYGLSDDIPFSEEQNVDYPISLYAASKKSNELMAHAYSHLFGIPTTGLRFFTVYGPWGRPDMAMYLFAKAISNGNPISIFNNGNMQRDFTYIDDIIEGILRVLDKIPEVSLLSKSTAKTFAPYKIYNIGNNNPVNLLAVIELLEKNLGKTALRNYMPIQQGDVFVTYANIDSLFSSTGFKPSTSIENGIEKFISWYVNYHSK
jgi:UDP-glucuronate 4-epimerase